MQEPIALEIARLQNADIEDLRKRYQDVFGESPNTQRTRNYLLRKIAYRMQEQRFGGLSEEAQNILHDELAKVNPPDHPRLRSKTQKKSNRDKRIPMPGTILTRTYKRQAIQVKVLDSGFEYQNKVFATLSAVAKEITGSHWNGMKFFNL